MEAFDPLTMLYTYCITVDDGAAPNPFWGVCTLAICKPVVRRVAQIGDWVVGTGSVNSPIGDIGGKVVYAMKVTDKMTMEAYDEYTRKHLEQKIPSRTSNNRRIWLGDSIYDFGQHPPKIRKSVHNERNRDTDLGGKFVLLSTEFFYFGNKPIELPENLKPIARQGQGHNSQSNSPFVESFIKWLYGLGLKPNVLNGSPQRDAFKNEEAIINCAATRRRSAEEDEKLDRLLS